jgi:hypothetical protein
LGAIMQPLVCSSLADRLLSIEFSVRYYFAPRHDKKDSRLSILYIAHGTDDMVGVLGILPGSCSSGWYIFPLASPAAGFGLSASTTYLDNEYACCKGAIVVAAGNSKIIVANVAVTTISVILVSLLLFIV